MRKPKQIGFSTAVWTTFFLVLGCALLWILRDEKGFSFSANAGVVFKELEWWRLFTALIIHGDVGHLLSNTFLFFIFGWLLSGHFSRWVFPTMALLFGALINASVLLSSDPEMHLVGISGVVYWMGAVWLTLYALVSRHLTIVQRALRVVGVALMIFMPTEAFNPQISYKAHALGFGWGVLFGLLYFLWRRKDFQAAEIYEISQEDPEPENIQT